MLCILTSERGLRMPFAGRNQFFDAKTTFSVTNETKERYSHAHTYTHTHAHTQTLNLYISMDASPCTGACSRLGISLELLLPQPLTDGAASKFFGLDTAAPSMSSCGINNSS